MALPQSILQRGSRASQPAASAVAEGTLYCVTDENYILEQSVASAWVDYSPTGGSGTVTNTGTLTANALILGNGGVDVTPMASLGTTTTVLHGNAAGAPTFGAVSLTADVSGDLPFANLAQIAGLSVLGVTGSSTADVAAITAATDNHVLTRVSSSSLAFAMPAVVKIEEQTPSGTGTVTFSSLGSFTHLRILYSARGSQAAASTAITMQFNGDTGANYDRQVMFANNTAVAATESFAATSAQIGTVVAASGMANAAGAGTIEIYDYRGTTFYKDGISLNSLPRDTTSGNFFVQQFSQRWRSTAAITSITLTLASGNFVAGSKFTLYGLN